MQNRKVAEHAPGEIALPCRLVFDMDQDERVPPAEADLGQQIHIVPGRPSSGRTSLSRNSICSRSIFPAATRGKNSSRNSLKNVVREIFEEPVVIHRSPVPVSRTLIRKRACTR